MLLSLNEDLRILKSAITGNKKNKGKTTVQINKLISGRRRSIYAMFKAA
jgi:hypothetical protein